MRNSSYLSRLLARRSQRIGEAALTSRISNRSLDSRAEEFTIPTWLPSRERHAFTVRIRYNDDWRMKRVPFALRNISAGSHAISEIMRGSAADVGGCGVEGATFDLEIGAAEGYEDLSIICEVSV